MFFLLCNLNKGLFVKGDSGGPLVKKFGSRNVLVGITSWGPADCGNSPEPGVFVDVEKHLEWILKNTKENETAQPQLYQQSSTTGINTKIYCHSQVISSQTRLGDTLIAV